MAAFSQTSKSALGRASAYLITATGGAGMICTSQYKSLKNVYGNTSLSSLSPIEQSSLSSVSKPAGQHQHRHIKFIASTEHGLENRHHPRGRLARRNGTNITTSQGQSGHGRVTREGNKRSVFPRHGVL